jgi:hypothetical protein
MPATATASSITPSANPALGDISVLADSFRRSLRAQTKSRSHVENYDTAS